MQNSYDYIAEQWHSNFRGQSYTDRVLRYVDLVLDGVQAGAKILDLGCGTGNPIAKYILHRGYQVIGVDQSEKMLEIAKQVIPEAALIHGDSRDLDC
jgi:ubiquinone/menaquinone biosynthesis C-methylase UbiE